MPRFLRVQVRMKLKLIEIDRLLQRGSERLLELQCERDDLFCAPHPLFNYSTRRSMIRQPTIPFGGRED